MRKKIWIGMGAVLGTALIIVLWLVNHRSNETRDRMTVHIGAILALTGDGAEFGKDELVGAQIAIDGINATTTSMRLELMVEDSRTQAKDAVSAYQKLMSSGSKPVALLTVMSSVSSALVPLVEGDQIPLFCVAAAPALTQGNKYVFRALPAADYQARTLLQLSKSKLNYNSVSVLFVNDEFGTSMELAFASAAKERGVNLLRSEGIKTDTSDFRPSLTKLIDSRPDVIYLAAFGSILGSAVRQLRELGYTGTVLTTLEIGYPKVLDVAGKAADGAVFVDTLFDPSSPDPSTVSFIEEFKKRANRQPSLDAILAYDEVQMIYAAGAHKGFSSEAVRAGLLETRDYKSINGSASMLPNGDVAYELILKVIKSGRPVPMDR